MFLCIFVKFAFLFCYVYDISMWKLDTHNIDLVPEDQFKENILWLKKDAEKFVKNKVEQAYKKLEKNVPRVLSEKEEELKRKEIPSQETREKEERRRKAKWEKAKIITLRKRRKQGSSMVYGLITKHKKLKSKGKNAHQKVEQPKVWKVINTEVTKSVRQGDTNIRRMETTIVSKVEYIEKNIKNKNSEVYEEVKKQCELDVWHIPTDQEIDIYIEDNDVIASLALQKTIQDLVADGWSQEEIAESFNQASSWFIDKDESSFFDIYIQETVESYFVFNPAPSLWEDIVVHDIPWAKNTFEEAIADEAYQTRVVLQPLTKAEQKKVFTYILENKEWKEYVNEEELNYLKDTYGKNSNTETKQSAELEKKILDKWIKEKQEILTKKAHVQEFSMQTDTIQTLMNSTTNDQTVRTSQITYANGIHTSLQILSGSTEYNKVLEGNQMKSLTGIDRKIDVGSPKNDRNISLSATDALTNRLPLDPHKITQNHKLDAQKYIYQECVLEEVCRSMNRADTTSNMGSIADDYPILLQSVDQILSTMSLEQMKDILALLQTEVWQISMAHSILPQVLQWTSSDTSAPNNIAWFFWTYIWKQDGPMWKESLVSPDLSKFESESIERNIKVWNDTLTITDDMEKENARTTLGKMIWGNSEVRLDQWKNSAYIVRI